MSNKTDFSWTFPYPSQRMPVFAANVVATSQPLATQAGLHMLRRGGNAVDAALAAAITLTVVEPNNNGIGSDAFAIVFDGERLHGLNGSGRSPRAWTPDRFAGRTSIPILGWDAVTVPGAVDLWATLSKRFGNLPFPDLFEPAIRYARDGFLVSPITAWESAVETYRDYPNWLETFAPAGRAPKTGELFRSPDHARTLDLIARTNGETFYRGELAQRIIDHSNAAGGAMTLADLSDHHAEWVDPICTGYRGHDLHEIPPNGQGIAALIALGILRHHDLAAFPVDSADSIHLQVEAMKIAFAQAHRHVADPAHMNVSPEALLDESFLAQQAKQIRMDTASHPTADMPANYGTVYLTAADASGMMVSFIQSNFKGFGSGIVIPNTGIAMQNRACGFTLAPGHPNQIDGNKRPYHTIIPAFVTRDRAPVMSFGVMGGHHQPQGHVRMIVRLFDYHQNPQAAIDAPRWHIGRDFNVALEPGIPPSVRDELHRRGHQLVEPTPGLFGGAQSILKLQSGYCAASDPRKDGQATGF